MLTDTNWEHYTGGNLVWKHPVLDKQELEQAYLEFRRMFYSWPSILKRFWANRRQPTYYFAMNFTHWWRAYRNPLDRAKHPSVAPRMFTIRAPRWSR